MIDYLSGRVAFVAPGSATIDVGGVGYLVSMSTKSLASLPACGEDVLVYTVLSASDAGIALYGFASVEEREMFGRLVGVKGIGPKAALALLSTLDPAALALAIQTGDDRAISTAPGIGKKSAQRIILELAGTLEAEPNLFSDERDGAKAEAGAVADATEALLGMGFTSAEAEVSLEGFEESGEPMETAAAIRYALSKLGASR